MLVACLSVAISQADLRSRFELTAPLTLPPVFVHESMAKHGIAQATARRTGTQARILWIDATANMGRTNSEEKIVALMKKVADVGFNTVVFDIKPISGYTLYPSQHSEQLTEWRDAKYEPGFDPVRIMLREAKSNGLSFLVALNAFSEGHSYSKRDFGKPDNQFFKPGWGYDQPELQSIRYVSDPTFKGLPVFPELNPPQWTTPIALFTRVPSATDIGAYAGLDSTGKVLWVAESKDATTEAPHVICGRGEGVARVLSLPIGGRVHLEGTTRYLPSAQEQNQIPLMMNPHLEAVQSRALLFVEEVIRNYDVDGFLYDDRLRFGGIDTDFSESTRRDFERHVGRQISWPEDIFTFTHSITLQRGIKPGTYYDAWMSWRAEVMNKWVQRVRAKINSIRPRTMFGIYAGSWYGDYQKYGNNYASNELEAGFPFLTRAYQKTGFARELDMLITGCYYDHGTVHHAVQANAPAGRTVEAAGIMSNRVARDQTWTYAGIQLANFWNDPSRVEPALQAACATTQGIMVFDLSHRIDEFWPIFEQAFKKRTLAPHQVPNLLESVRAQRADFDRRGFKDPPFPMFEGAPGTGF
ncbi:family 10 glycosylhydrolase [Kamptonema cortianum]|nr:family 10 glycosylhydrolase [Geitlerinema splendidum]MDK3157690.1 family 10 glycosylhydrolase [Kamptonema cortianum]